MTSVAQHRARHLPATSARHLTLARITHPHVGAPARRGVNTWWGNVSLLVAGAAVYFGVRHLTQGTEPAADRHAHWVTTFEQRLGLHHEAWVQDHTASHGWVTAAADDIYIYGHWPFIIATMTWLLIRHREQFTLARNALLLSGGLALIVFAAFPVTPPRLADPAITDTVAVHTNAYRLLQPPAFTNAYAAMPSLHCGWDLLVAGVLASTFASRWIRAVLAAVPVLMAASVIITGNHYFVDVLAGDLLATAALVAVRHFAGRRTAQTPPVVVEQPVRSGVAAARHLSNAA
jgi:membrane-associated phospholipid phosphatase